jgi:hypothetical protein
VPTTIDTIQNFEGDGTTYKSWNLVKIDGALEVAEIKIYDRVANRFMIMLNGVMMLPCNFPLTAVSPTGDIPISQGKCEVISEFAYSKSIPSKTKVDESILDEVKRLMIRKMRQSNEPPKGSRKSKVHGRDIFNPGKITYDIQEGDIFDLIQNPGITSSDFSFYQLVQEDINNKSINAVASGEGVQGDPTATQVLEEKQQAMIKLGLALDGILNLERQLVWNRIHNILVYWTKPTSGEIDEVPGRRDQLDEEEAMSKNGKKTRLVYMNPKLLKTVKLFWFVSITASPKSNDALSVMLFVQNITTAANLFGIESLNMDYLKQRFATLTKEDYSKMFVSEDLLAMIQQQQQQAEANGAKPKKAGMKDAVNGGRELKPVIQ